jgi:glycosyltransferase involved in cell wall biosynthesis
MILKPWTMTVPGASLRVSFDPGLQQRDILGRAGALLEIGESDRAKQVLSALRPQLIGSAREAVIATEMFLDVHLLESALASAERAVELDRNHPDAAELREECRYRLDLPATWQAESREIHALLERLNASAHAPHAAADQHVHIVAKLDTLGGSERRALNLARCLSAHMPTTLWSTHPAHAAHVRENTIRLVSPETAPQGGTLVLIGTYFPCGDWLETGCFDRVIICHNLIRQNRSLLERLRRIGTNPAYPPVQLVFPSKMFRDLLGLPGGIEYSSVDLDRFRRASLPVDVSPSLKIGRHGREYVWNFHPNDPAFFRGLMARGHRVRILGGTAIARAFSRDAIAPELIEAGAFDAWDFLADLDVFVYRKHPQWIETGGTVILEAMAMELPVIVFPEQCGCAELIVHDENGFLPSSEAEASELIEHLRANPELRRRIGAAARQTIVDLQRRQEPEIIARYRG